MPPEAGVVEIGPAVVAIDDGDDLGESPFWDTETQRLLRVDIEAGLHHSWSPREGAGPARAFPGLLAFAIPRRGGGLVCGLDHSLIRLDADGSIATIAKVDDGFRDNRFNDAKCDRAGRLLAGTMSMSREHGVASLYRLEPGGLPEPVVDRLTISNGLGWSPDDRTMYLIDSPSQTIDAFDYDLAAGTLRNRRTFAAIEPEEGLPDGLTVDAEGGVWVALFGGGRGAALRPGGELDLRLPMPVTNCTCPTFGGAALDELYVTTARHKLCRAELAEQPHAGAVFRARPGHRSLAAHRFAG